MEALKLTEQQIQFLADHDVIYDFQRMTDDDFVQLEERVGDILALEGLDEDYDDNEIGRQAREILDLLV